MRHRNWTAAVSALAALVALGAAGCADQPDATIESRSEVTSRSAGIDAADPGARREAGVALLWDGDVAEEGVQALPGAGPAPSECVARALVTDHVAAWRYPTGSVLLNAVTAVSGSGLEAITDAECTGQRVKLRGLGKIDGYRAWCAPDDVDGTTCTVLLARKHLVSALEVTAGDPVRAEAAAVRLAPIAAQALSRR